MRNEIIFDDDYSFKGKGTLDKTFLRVSNENVKEWFTRSIKEFNEIYENYQKALSDDGKILSSERNDLISELDDFFNLLLTFYIFIVEDKDKTFEVYVPNWDFRFTATVLKHTWTASGIYPELFLKATEDFNTFYKNTLSKKFKEFISAFKDYPISENAKVPEKVRFVIQKIISELFYFILKIRFQIEKCMINY
jgi:hypothetical protein